MVCGIAVCFLVLLATFSSGAQNQPKIFTKDGSVHIRSGDNGNIIFEPSSQGKVLIGRNELNMTAGAKGDPGERGNDGTNGSRGERGEKGEPGQRGVRGEKGNQGEMGPAGLNGTNGQPGLKGIKGEKGVPGLNGSIGSQGPNGTQGPRGEMGPNGTRGAKGDPGDTSYFRGPNSPTLVCNSSMLGGLRYLTTKLQLCTPDGWKNVVLEKKEDRCQSGQPNVPETNFETFNSADNGILFEFNNDSSLRVNSRTTFNITADILPMTTTLSYEDAAMRQAAHFSGNSYINVSGLPENFWRTSNWSVMALMKFGDRGNLAEEVQVLGHGVASNNHGLHVGISKKQPINGYYNNDIKYNTVLKPNNWYHITWTSQKLPGNREKRCIIVNGKNAQCGDTQRLYQGSGDTTIGSWWHRDLKDDFDLDQLTIISGIVRYNFKSEEEQQLCYARLVDKKLP